MYELGFLSGVFIAVIGLSLMPKVMSDGILLGTKKFMQILARIAKRLIGGNKAEVARGEEEETK